MNKAQKMTDNLKDDEDSIITTVEISYVQKIKSASKMTKLTSKNGEENSALIPDV